ncbi:dihydroorotate oxidase B electron transfer subunit [Thermolongibacillus altinsuensis]|uniref:Dihydroorotate dehydrogenase B (NAD(+)), electron transfer subunit n=1 Tax=Thermolongibacillus altinsuensis TaxID=575256 RepID=A0A4R1QGM5_9BACL|nr:dihydroorotate dehydrogenase electron transfer subunit [Thermolongibacillus altinsuensis]TCL50308.1 dihydroorotate oxidase B electron transfer subunit [Thermolongibacillus altinsuensis]
MMKREHMMIVAHEPIAENIYALTLTGPLVHEMNKPGQFVHIKITSQADPLLRRPLSLCQIDKETSQCTIIYRKEGIGTTLLSEKRPGETVDVLGPLGNGFPLDAVKAGQTALIVGGGIGVPPLYELSKRLVKKDVNVIHVLGFQNKDVMFYKNEFAKLGETHVATVDGSYGTKGLVTDVIAECAISFDVLYACGPKPMLKALEQAFPNKEVYLSLEERMGCGIGACFACVCRVPNSETAYKKVCSDGPVFKAGEVIL